MRQDIHIHLASGSQIRAQLLRNAGIEIAAKAVDVDEDSIKSRLLQAGSSPEEIALRLAQEKALALEADGYVIGADQVLDFDSTILSKPKDRAEAKKHLLILRGQTHKLHSAVAVVRDHKQAFHHVATVTLTMRAFSDGFLDEYLDRNWPEISYAVGGYMLEEEGGRLFREIDGDYFTVLGLPLLPLLNFFADEGAISA
ncbi:MAG: Maf family protein [Rhodobacteraceae bacterium]|nr:Maf family protein [Paracoccaceae bacterium]